MMNTLRIEHRAHHSNDGNVYIITELLIDDALLEDFYGMACATDLEQLTASTQSSGEYFAITCSCGIPGCVGIWQGIEVRREAKVVYWHVLYPTPERKFVFELEEYDSAIEEAGSKASHWMAQQLRSITKPVHVVPDQNSHYFGITDNHS